MDRCDNCRHINKCFQQCKENASYNNVDFGYEDYTKEIYSLSQSTVNYGWLTNDNVDDIKLLNQSKMYSSEITTYFI